MTAGRALSRVMFWNQVYLPHLGGVEIFTARLAAGLLERGYRIMVVALLHEPGLPERETMDGVEIVRLPFQKPFRTPDPLVRIQSLGRLTRAVAALKADFRPDIVHVNLSDPSPLLHLRTLGRERTVLVQQSAFLQRADQDGVTARLLAEASAIVAVSHAAACNIATCSAVPLDRIEVIHPGIPKAEFEPVPARRERAVPRAMLLGRVAPEKGCDTAIGALARMGGAMQLDVVGTGEALPAMRELAVRLGVAERVTFHGRVDDATRRQLLAESDVLLVPSRHEELFGMVAVEGMLSGLPVLAAATGGLQEVVVPEATGLLLPKDDVGAWAMALDRLAASPELRRSMGMSGRVRALAHFTMADTIDAYHGLYARLTADRDACRTEE